MVGEGEPNIHVARTYSSYQVQVTGQPSIIRNESLKWPSARLDIRLDQQYIFIIPKRLVEYNSYMSTWQLFLTMRFWWGHALFEDKKQVSSLSSFLQNFHTKISIE